MAKFHAWGGRGEWALYGVKYKWIQLVAPLAHVVVGNFDNKSNTTLK
jgi:hypothetical protein